MTMTQTSTDQTQILPSQNNILYRILCRIEVAKRAHSKQVHGVAYEMAAISFEEELERLSASLENEEGCATFTAEAVSSVA